MDSWTLSSAATTGCARLPVSTVRRVQSASDNGNISRTKPSANDRGEATAKPATAKMASPAPIRRLGNLRAGTRSLMTSAVSWLVRIADSSAPRAMPSTEVIRRPVSSGLRRSQNKARSRSSRGRRSGCINLRHATRAPIAMTPSNNASRNQPGRCHALSATPRTTKNPTTVPTKRELPSKATAMRRRRRTSARKGSTSMDRRMTRRSQSPTRDHSHAFRAV